LNYTRDGCERSPVES